MLNLDGERVQEYGKKTTLFGIYAQKLVSPARLSRKLTLSQACGGASTEVERFAKTYRISHTTVDGCEGLTANECWARFPTVNDFFIRKRVDLPPPSSSPSAYASYLLRQYKEATGLDVRRSDAKKLEKRVIASPADNFSVYLNGDALRQKLWIKGEHFSVQRLFAEPKLESDGYQLMIFRLAPQHYHRFHCPLSGKVRSLYYTGSEYFSVNPIVVRSAIDVFTRNVRLVLELENAFGDTVHMAIIGATCVGSIEITHPRILSALKQSQLFARNLEHKVVFKRPPVIRVTEELGNFQFGGSSVALYFPGTYRPTPYGEMVQHHTLRRKTPFETETRVGQMLFTR